LIPTEADTMQRMDFDEVEKKALKLPAQDRARLARDLLDSLEPLPPEESRRQWLDEAERRAADLDRGGAALTPADEVARKARTLLK
jgi:putative addiction module component (TIGR02574 family)